MSTESAPATKVDLEILPTQNPLGDAERAQRMQNPGFGRLFTEHMVVIPYAADRGGWLRGQLKPYAPITLDPAAMVLHYGQAIFEGFKAYRQPDGRIKTFRPEANAHRFNSSARRLAMPEMPVELFVGSIDALIRQDRAWVPAPVGESLYIRPLMFATEAALGVRSSREYDFLVIASPAGAYFPQGVKPVTVWISEDFVRAAPGGTGAAKFAGNYAASLLAQMNAAAEGCAQVVWLDAVHRRYVEEMGGMNIFFVYEEGGRPVLVTPELTGTLLPGITRDSIMQLARDFGYGAEERKVTFEEWGAAVRDGRMTEAFACGTAAVITPIGAVKSREGTFAIHDNETGPVAARFREALLNIQHGLAPDRHGWMHDVI
ncbi:branched-chain amino acid aminotransferase [Sorangium sp. So ce388]|uniref:branched-chain amino acid aminotransferase n=1 Tax=Sorangium sp. So ce388 TaxID=3133309 RepID=UPI003F5B96E1